jgi:hypothetical protein
MTVAEVLVKNNLLEMFIPSKKAVFYTHKGFDEFLFNTKRLRSRPHQIREEGSEVELFIINTEADTKEHSRVYLFDSNTLRWKGLKVYMKNGQLIDMEIQKIIKGIPAEFSIKIRDSTIRMVMKDVEVNIPVRDSIFMKRFYAERLPFESLLKEL